MQWLVPRGRGTKEAIRKGGWRVTISLNPTESRRVLSPPLDLGQKPAGSDPGPSRTSPKIPGSLFGCGSSLVFFGSLLFRGLTARGARMGLELALKNVTMKGCLERGARCPSRPARPGSTLCPETERGERAVTRGQWPGTWTQQGPLPGLGGDLSRIHCPLGFLL